MPIKVIDIKVIGMKLEILADTYLVISASRKVNQRRDGNNDILREADCSCRPLHVLTWWLIPRDGWQIIMCHCDTTVLPLRTLFRHWVRYFSRGNLSRGLPYLTERIRVEDVGISYLSADAGTSSVRLYLGKQYGFDAFLMGSWGYSLPLFSAYPLE